MADSENEYARLSALIEEIEGLSKRNETSFLDMSEIIDRPKAAKKNNYNELVDIITEVESGGRRFSRESQERLREQLIPQQPAPIQIPKQKQAAKQQPQQLQKIEPQLVTTGVVQSQFTQPSVAKPEQEQKVKKPFALFQPREKKQVSATGTVEERRQSAGAELGAIANRLASIKPPIPELPRKKINIKYLVLPNLSVADQIAELERIIEGLRENVFDAQHIDIVSQEVYGLQQVVNEAKKKARGKEPELNELEKSLWDLRNQRLAEAVSLLQQSGVK